MTDSLKIVIEQVRLEGGLKIGGRIRVAECLWQTVSNSWASVKIRSFTQCVYTTDDKGLGVGYGSLLSCWGVRLKEIGQTLSGCSRNGTEAELNSYIECDVLLLAIAEFEDHDTFQWVLDLVC